MIYDTINQPKKLDTAHLDAAVSFACEYLKLDIDFTIQFETLYRYQYGFCDYDEDEAVITIAKRLSPIDITRTLFHELVHLKQYSDGRLVDGNPQVWEGKIYAEAYENLPWEVEAFEHEEKMMMSFYS
jgi:hypothetical protein